MYQNITALIIFDIIISAFVYVCVNKAYGYDQTRVEYSNFFAPWVVYKFTKLNWLGAVLVSLFLMTICWAYVIIYFLWWILHVGRREKDKE